MAAGIVYLQTLDPASGVSALLPFAVVATALFVFFAFTQETAYQYGMDNKRALSYSLAIAASLFGILAAAIMYFRGSPPYLVWSVLTFFVFPSAVALTYLALSEKSRQKEWVRKWAEKWAAEWEQTFTSQHGVLRRGLSGALWLFSIAVFLIMALNGGGRYAWIVFIFAIGIEVLMSAVFAARGRK